MRTRLSAMIAIVVLFAIQLFAIGSAFGAPPDTIWADPAGMEAAELLRGYLSRITGRNWKHSAAAQAVIRLKLRPNRDNRDEFLLRSNGRTLDITASNSRSLVYGVCALLEKTAGCRFYTPAEEHIPKNPGWKIPEKLDYKERAAFRSRQIRLEWDQNDAMALWAAKNRFNTITMDFWLWDHAVGESVRKTTDRYGLEIGGNGHGVFHFLKADTYFASHPEWYPEVDGKRVPARNTGDNICYSNPAARAELIRNLVAYCEAHPYLSSINLWPGDGGLICRCPQCSGHSMMELYGVLMTEARRELAERCPHVKFSMLAYNYDQMDKTFSTMNPPKTASTVPTMFAFWGQNLMVPLRNNPEESHSCVRKYMIDYARKHPGQASVFLYYTDTYSNSDICPSFGKSMVQDLNFYRELGMDELCLLWIPWAPSNNPWTLWVATLNAALLGHLSMDPAFPMEELYRTGTLELQKRLDEILSPITGLISRFTPPRVADAWGCGFNREVMKWEPTPERRKIEVVRLETFREVEKNLKVLVSQLPGKPDDELRRLCDYIRYCDVRISGLRRIFEAQMAIRDHRWAEAASWLEQSLATNMQDEQFQTSSWLQTVKQRMLQMKAGTNEQHRWRPADPPESSPRDK